MTACVTDTPALSDAEKSLAWVKDANPTQDAKAALQQGDFRLMALAQRSIVIPGVSDKHREKYEKACGVRMLEGFTDSVRGEAHLELLKKAHSYARQYNEIIRSRCNP